MNPFFVPRLALLLMEGVGRRAMAHVIDAPGRALVAAYQPVPVTRESAGRQILAGLQKRSGFRPGRNFGRPGSFQ